MKDNRILIAYGSRMGATEETASEIASILREKYRFEVDVVDLKKNPTPDTRAGKEEL
jgi:menaquinone-dependent protoporphyrinogen IX oxidase